MRRLGRSASVLVAFFLLASAATASAECAWILWAGGVKASGEPVYAPIEGAIPRGENA
jgi:hypothetical protein